MADDLGNFFGSLAGKIIPGGCPTCAAEQRVEDLDGAWLLVVAHEEHCPQWRSRSARSN